jgi:hypothetical protein
MFVSGYHADGIPKAVDINSVTRVPEPTKETWQSLVLPHGHKDMVYSLVQSRFRARQRSGGDNEVQADLVRGKGRIVSSQESVIM